MANDDYSAAGSCSNFGATLAKLFTNLSGPQTTGYAVITTYTEGNVLTNFNRNMVIIVPAD